MGTIERMLFCVAFLLGACSKTQIGEATLPKDVDHQLQKLSRVRAEAEKKDNLASFLAHYEANAVSMPEYQPILTGIKEIEAFYREIFRRQNVRTFQITAEEFIHLDRTVIEIGTFQKEYTNGKTDNLVRQHGKYWHVWAIQPDGNFQLKGESFGFFHPVEQPEALVVHLPPQTGALMGKEIPFELRAYNALMEKGVRLRDGTLRAEFFTNDGRFMPFADSTLTGMAQIKPYLIGYNKGEVTIDSIQCETYRYEYLDDCLLEYAQFKVKWTLPRFSGRTEGKGIRIWKRQADQSLKLFREIGTHTHLE